MRLQEKHILHENGDFWVLDDVRNNAYTVMRNGSVCAASDSSYRRDSGGLSCAIARCDYLARRKAR